MVISKDSLEWITLFLVYLIGIFWGTLNASWGYFGFMTILVEIFIIIILVTDYSGGANNE